MSESQTIFPYEREPIYHVGTSTGKDSVGLMLWVIHKSGLPRDRVRFTFCDTGNEDPLTYSHLEYLNANVVIPAGYQPIETLVPHLQFFDLCFKKGRFPSRKAQFCTIELKIEPTKQWIRERWKEGDDVVLLNGKRIGESNERRLSMQGQPARAFSDFWGCEEWSPLRDFTLEQVFDLHREFGVPLNPLYGLGARRVGCWPCINCGKHEIRLVAKHRPEKIDQIESEEKRHQVGLGRISTFYPGATTTANHNDLTYTRTDGATFGTSSIRAVVKWAHTKRGGVEPRTEDEPAPACHLGYLSCE